MSRSSDDQDPPNEPDPEDLLKRLYEARGESSRFERTLEEIAAVHTEGIERTRLRSNVSSEPMSLIITGEPGVGKSEVINAYSRSHPARRTGTRKVIPVFVASIPANATVKGTLVNLLTSMGAPGASRGDATTLNRRFKVLLRECLVEIMILDEFQHLLTSNRRTPVADVSDWLKDLIIELKIPVVVVGLPASKAVLDQNEQLSRRFKPVRKLRPFNLRDNNEEEEYRKFLASYEEAIGFPKIDEWASSRWVKRIYIATSGNVGNLAHLVQNAGRRAIHDGAKHIENRHFANAFTDVLAEAAGTSSNPFTMTKERANAALNQVLQGMPRPSEAQESDTENEDGES